MNKEKIINCILLIIICIITFSVVNREFENDTFFTIAVGRKILNQGFYTDETFTIHEGLKFANIKWMFDILVTIIYNLWGFNGIYAFTIIASMTLALSIYYVLKKNDVSKYLAFFITALIMFLISGALSCRAQIVSYIILVLEFFFVGKLFNTGKKKYSIILIILSILMANVHGPLFPMFIVIFMPYLAELILGNFKLFKDGRVLKDSKIIIEIKDKETIKLFTITFIICSLGGFITPYANTFLAYTDMFKALGESLASEIAELTTKNILYNTPLLISLTGCIMVLMFSKRIKLPHFLYILGFGLIGLLNTRNEYYFYIFGLMNTSMIVQDLLNKYGFNKNVLDKSIKYVAFSGICILICFNSLIRIIEKQQNEYLNQFYLCPVQATNFLLNNYDVDKIRMLNSFNTGAYMEFRGLKVFIDSRMEIFSEKFNDTTVYRDATLIYNGGEIDELSGLLTDSYKGILNKYKITHIVMERKWCESNKKLLESDWHLLYIDDGFCIYEKNDYVKDNV